MSRETKFRAWDKKSKKMRAVNCIVFHYENECFADPKGRRAPMVISLWGYDPIEDGGKHIILHREAADVELLEFTGLKDKNGKEIYEGDIVMVINYLNGEPWEGHIHPCVVHFSGGRFELKDHWMGESLSGSTLEVIGNIQENPELLK